MLKWYCDFCGQEIKKPNNPIQISVYTELINRDLRGYGEADYVTPKNYCCKECVSKIREAIINAINNQKK